MTSFAGRLMKMLKLQLWNMTKCHSYTTSNLR